MRSLFIRSIVVTAVLVIVICGFYPIMVTILAQIAFSGRANGSLIEKSGKVIGSELIGQAFSRPEYFHGRPSAAGDKGYDAANSSGTNFGPTNKKLADGVKAGIDRVMKENSSVKIGEIPVETVTASASGLDPHISPEAAMMQVERIYRARNADPEKIKTMIIEQTGDRTLGMLGEKRVNVLLLNLKLDKEAPVAAVSR